MRVIWARRSDQSWSELIIHSLPSTGCHPPREKRAYIDLLIHTRPVMTQPATAVTSPSRRSNIKCSVSRAQSRQDSLPSTRILFPVPVDVVRADVNYRNPRQLVSTSWYVRPSLPYGVHPASPLFGFPIPLSKWVSTPGSASRAHSNIASGPRAVPSMHACTRGRQRSLSGHANGSSQVA